MPSSPLTSLIIPTYRREQSLIDCLQSAQAQDYGELEILVLDQTERHDEATSAYLAGLAPRFRHLSVSPPSAVAARNRGLLEARGKYVVIIDDDTTFEPSFVSAHVEALQRGADVVQGRVVERDWGVSYRAQWMLPWIRVVGSNTYDKPAETNTLTSCNFSMKREAYEQVGLFDTKFSGSLIREDADYGVRCYRAGLTM